VQRPGGRSHDRWPGPIAEASHDDGPVAFGRPPPPQVEFATFWLLAVPFTAGPQSFVPLIGFYVGYHYSNQQN